MQIKSILAIAFSALLSSGLAAAQNLRSLAEAPVVKPNEACFYLEKDWKGDSHCFHFSRSVDLATKLAKFDKKVQSITFGKNIEAVLVFENSDFSGYQHRYIQSMPCLEEGKSDFSRLVVQRRVPDNKVCLYKRKFYSGKWKCFQRGGFDMCDEKYGGCNGKYNDQFQSIQVGKNVKFVGFEHKDFYGKKRYLIDESKEKMSYQEKRVTSFVVMKRD